MVDHTDNHRQRRSIRLPGYDYAQEGAYFITICTQNRTCLFGRIVGAGPCACPCTYPMNESLARYGEESWMI